MPIFSKLVALGIAFIFFRIFFGVVRKQNVKPFFAFIWLMITFAMFSVLLFEGAYKWFATQMGLRDASFLIFLFAMPFLLIYSLYLSQKVSELSDRCQELISSGALLEKRLRIVEKTTAQEKLRKVNK